MLKFLRRIRASAIIHSKGGKYLIYAFGEILLIVIGILIALQVNNWNLNRENLNKSIDYHQRMIDDLDHTISFLNSVFDFSDQVQNNIVEAVEILKKGVYSEENKKILDDALVSFFRLSRNLPELTTYKEMESSGQLGLIYNTSLRKEIADYLITWNLVSTVSEDLNEKVNEMEFIDPYLKFGKESSFRETVVEYDFNDLATDKRVINTLSRYGFHWKTKSSFSKSLAEEASQLKSLIEQELIRLK